LIAPAASVSVAISVGVVSWMVAIFAPSTRMSIGPRAGVPLPSMM
jgi:hypothetical protein